MIACPGRPCKTGVPPQEHVCGRLIRLARDQWALVATAATIGLALAYPAWGASVYKPVSVGLIAGLFFIIGFNIDLTELRSGMLAVHYHGLFQVYSLLATPLLYYVTCFYPAWPRRLGILTQRFGIGTMAAMCLPTTTNTGPIFVLQTGGDQSVASVNAAAGNILGPFVAPLMAGWLLASEVGHVDAAKKIVSLSEQILAPLACGVMLQLAASRCCPNVFEHVRSAGKVLSPVLLVSLFYFIFCKAFGASTDGMSLASVAKLVGWVTLVFMCNLGLAAIVGCRFGHKRFVSFVICAPQKTESLGVALLTVIFAHDDGAIGELTLPIVCYHTIELVVGALLLPYLTRVAAREPHSEHILLATHPLQEPLTDPVAATVEEGQAFVGGEGPHAPRQGD